MITSTANLAIKAIRRLRERKERQASGLFYCEGLRIVGDAFDHKADFDCVLAAPELLQSEFGLSLLEKAASRNIPVVELSAGVFTWLSQKDHPQGIAAVCKQSWTELDHLRIEPGKLVTALDSVADPGNLGTIMRTLDGTGGKGVILLDQSTDPYDPGALRASMGSLFNLQITRSSLAEFAGWKKQTGVRVIGTSGASREDYHGYPYPDPMVLLMGSERQGLTPEHIQLCDGMVSIPMVGSADSLNLAVATAVVIYEVFNQRRMEKTVRGGTR
jgi:TrmH family RNA methyltransferase